MKTAEKSTKQLRDLELIALVREGGKKRDEAFARIYANYSEELMFQFIIKTKGEHADAQDLVMETMAKAFEKIDQFNPDKGAFSTWLYKMANNHFIDHLRRNKTEVLNLEALSTGTDDDVMEFQIEDKSGLNPEELFSKSQRINITRAALNAIENDKYRDIMKMRYLDELSYGEIVEALGIPLGSIKAIIYRAKIEMLARFKRVDMP